MNEERNLHLHSVPSLPRYKCCYWTTHSAPFLKSRAQLKHGTYSKITKKQEGRGELMKKWLHERKKMKTGWRKKSKISKEKEDNN